MAIEAKFHISASAQTQIDKGAETQSYYETQWIRRGRDRHDFRVPHHTYKIIGLEKQLAVCSIVIQHEFAHFFLCLCFPGGVLDVETMWSGNEIQEILKQAWHHA